MRLGNSAPLDNREIADLIFRDVLEVTNIFNPSAGEGCNRIRQCLWCNVNHDDRLQNYTRSNCYCQSKIRRGYQEDHTVPVMRY